MTRMQNSATAYAAPPATPGPGAPDDEPREPTSDLPTPAPAPDPAPDVVPPPVYDPGRPIPIRAAGVLTPAVQRVLAWHRQHAWPH
jgi:hypothetical protein